MKQKTEPSESHSFRQKQDDEVVQDQEPTTTQAKNNENIFETPHLGVSRKESLIEGGQMTPQL